MWPRHPVAEVATRPVERVDHLAIGTGLEVVGLRQPGLELAMVVDLAVDRQYQLAVDRTNGLRAACRVDDGEAFMDQARALVEEIGRASCRERVCQYV